MRYADDFFLFGEIQQLKTHYQSLKEKYEAIGLQFAPDKTEIFMPHASLIHRIQVNNDLPIDLKQSSQKLEKQGLKILGIPIGHDVYVKQKLSGLISKYQSDLQIIQSTCSHQQVFKVLQLSASVFQHILAVIPPDTQA